MGLRYIGILLLGASANACGAELAPDASVASDAGALQDGGAVQDAGARADGAPADADLTRPDASLEGGQQAAPDGDTPFDGGSDAGHTADAGIDPPPPAGAIAFEEGPYLEAVDSDGGYSFFTVQMADFTSDGHEDVLATDHGGGDTNHYWIGDGAGGFVLQDRVARGVGEEDTDIRGSLRTWVMDLEGDGDLDWGWDDTGGALSSMRVNDGTGTFTEVVLSSWWSVRMRAFGDYDGDGVLDVVDAHGRVFDGQLILAGTLRDRNAETLADVECDPVELTDEVVCASAYGVSRDVFQGNSLTRADFDGDGDDDAVVTIGADFASDNEQRLYRNDSDTLTDVGAVPSSVLSSDIGYSNAVAADFDNDGDPDLAFAGTTGSLYTVFENAGAFSFVEAVALPATCGACKAWLSAGDYDEDGRVDLAVLSGVGVQLYRNVSE